MASEEDDIMGEVADDNDDLFGGDDDDGSDKENPRQLSDRDLDSGDDEDRNDRAPQEEAGEVDFEGGRDARVLESTIWRHPLPKPSDGEFNTLRLPKFLGIAPLAYESETFKVPESDHHSDVKSANFSASAVSASTMRFRHNPTTGKMESNTNVYRWDDGSTTISIGDQHYELQTKPLAPPRDTQAYSENQDSHFYLASPSLASQLLLLVGHMANQHTVRPNEAVQDDALEKLQKSLAMAARRGTRNEKGPELIATSQDPELQKKRAEIAEKERMKAQRRRETAAEKASMSHRPVGGRSGGLSLDDLEGGRGRRAPAAGRKPPKPRKRRADYDTDDDDGPKGRSREDDYDLEDDFLAPSDEEEEAPVDDDEEEELDEESDHDRRKAKKQKTSRQEDVSDADADAEADLDDEEAPAAPVADIAGRNRKRNVIEDDDDE